MENGRRRPVARPSLIPWCTVTLNVLIHLAIHKANIVAHVADNESCDAFLCGMFQLITRAQTPAPTNRCLQASSRMAWPLLLPVTTEH